MVFGSYKKCIEKEYSQNGFSLIEVLVSLSIFIVVVTISVGALMSLIGANARTRNTQAAMTNISFALDSMTRDIRTGTDYYCGASSASLPTSGIATRDCTSASAFSFNEGGQSLTKNYGSRRIGYRLNGTSIERRLGNTGSWLPITAPEVSITQLHFYTTGSTRNDAGFLAPQVSIYVEGTAGDEANERGSFNVQTTVTQQLLDI